MKTRIVTLWLSPLPSPKKKKGAEELLALSQEGQAILTQNDASQLAQYDPQAMEVALSAFTEDDFERLQRGHMTEQGKIAIRGRLSAIFREASPESSPEFEKACQEVRDVAERLMQLLELRVLHAGRKSFSKGPYGGKRKPHTVKRLEIRNEKIRKEYARYMVHRFPDPIGLLVKHAPEYNAGKSLSRKQISRIVLGKG